MSSTRRILVADHAEAFDVFRRALVGAFDVVHVSSFEEAKAALMDPPALVACGCEFDEARMYDLLRFLKAAPGLGHVPFIATRCVEGELLTEALYESVKIAVRALGGNAFVDLLRWQDRWGMEQASSRLTHLVETLTSQPPDTAP